MKIVTGRKALMSALDVSTRQLSSLIQAGLPVRVTGEPNRPMARRYYADLDVVADWFRTGGGNQ